MKLLSLLAGACLNAIVSAKQCSDDSKCSRGASDNIRRSYLMDRHVDDFNKYFGEKASVVPSDAAECVGGEANGYGCNGIDLLSLTSLDDMTNGTATRGNDIWGWTDPLDQKEYALMGTYTGLAIVDVTDPFRTIPKVHLVANVSIWGDMKVSQNHVYFGSEASIRNAPRTDHGIQIFDLTRLREVTEWQIMEPDYVYRGLKWSHNVVINEDSKTLYVVGSRDTCSGGLHVLDLENDPKNPEFLGCADEDGYTHDAQCITYDGPDTRYTGKEICYAYNEDTVTIWEIKKSPFNATILSKLPYPGAEYVHQGWTTDDRKYILIDDELDEIKDGRDADPDVTDFNTKTHVADVSDLENPVYVGKYRSDKESIDHNQYVKNNLVYQSNYASGLRVFKLDDIATAELTEVAYFDVSAVNASEFVGSWSTYIYFPSGNIAISSIEYGLFMVREQTLPKITSQPTATPTNTPTTSPTITPTTSPTTTPTTSPTITSQPSASPTTSPTITADIYDDNVAVALGVTIPLLILVAGGLIFLFRDNKSNENALVNSKSYVSP